MTLSLLIEQFHGEIRARGTPDIRVYCGIKWNAKKFFSISYLSLGRIILQNFNYPSSFVKYIQYFAYISYNFVKFYLCRAESNKIERLSYRNTTRYVQVKPLSLNLQHFGYQLSPEISCQKIMQNKWSFPLFESFRFLRATVQGVKISFESRELETGKRCIQGYGA